jgi:hypothetical protein
MKIFVAYGYNPRDEWVPNLVFPIIRAFGAEVVTGERTYSGTIPDVIQNRVRASDALIGFLTRRRSPASWGSFQEQLPHGFSRSPRRSFPPGRRICRPGTSRPPTR